MERVHYARPTVTCAGGRNDVGDWNLVTCDLCLKSRPTSPPAGAYLKAWTEIPCDECGIEFQATRSEGRDRRDRELCSECAAYARGYADGVASVVVSPSERIRASLVNEDPRPDWTPVRVDRLLEWLASSPRKHPDQAFTSGPERDLARAIVVQPPGPSLTVHTMCSARLTERGVEILNESWTKKTWRAGDEYVANLGTIMYAFGGDHMIAGRHAPFNRLTLFNERT